MSHSLTPCTLLEPSTRYVVPPWSVHSDADHTYVVNVENPADWDFVDAAVRVSVVRDEYVINTQPRRVRRPARAPKPDVVRPKPDIVRPKRHRRADVYVPRLSMVAAATRWFINKARATSPNIGGVASDMGQATQRIMTLRNTKTLGVGNTVTKKQRSALRALLELPVDEIMDLICVGAV